MQNRLAIKHLLLIAILLFSPGSVFAQGSLLEKKISITLDLVPLEKALREIEKISGARFSYNSDILPADVRVSLAAKDKSLGKVLSVLLGKDYYFKSSGRYIILLKKIGKEKVSPQAQTMTVSGIVTDGRTALPLPFVTVYDMAGMASCLSDSLGRFSLSLTPITTTVALRCCKEDYSDSVASLNPALQERISFRLSVLNSPYQNSVRLRQGAFPLRTPRITVLSGGLSRTTCSSTAGMSSSKTSAWRSSPLCPKLAATSYLAGRW
jgi:hypothetical protein